MNKFLLLAETAVFACIAGANIYNIRLKARQDNFSIGRYVAVSLMKGSIYAEMFPFSVFYIAWTSVYDEKKFRTHFIPLSVYGSAEDNAELDDGNKETQKI